MRWVLAVSLLFSTQLHALVVCYDELANPAAISIEPFGVSVISLLGGSGWDAQTKTLPRVLFNGRGWQTFDRVSAQEHEAREPRFRKCGINIPLPKLSADEAKSLREWRYEPDEYAQEITACVAVDGVWYFGIGFYDGEGSTGVGGLGRYDPATGEIDIRRPEPLRGASVTAIAHHEGAFLLGTASFQECSGLVPVHGMLQYDWDSDRMQRVEEFPGFLIHDMMSHQGSVWVASDLGLSKGNREAWGYSWTHWTYTGDVEHPMQQEHRQDMYVRLLRTLPIEHIPAGDSSYGQFAEHLQAVQPEIGGVAMREVLKEVRGELAACRKSRGRDESGLMISE